MNDADGLPPFSARFREAYTGIALLGAGGMAQVFRAHQKALDRPVAIKVMRSLDPAERARFDREARSLAALSHAHIVRVFESGVDGDLAYLVMELVDGETVEARHDRARLALPEILAVVDQVAQALEYAHARGLVHRDVKPANAFLTRDDVVKLGDFGLARAVAHGATITNPALVMGTPQFMAPEQIAGKVTGPAVDQYALGVMLFWMVSGTFPHQSENVVDLLTARVSQRAPPLAGVSAEVATVVARMLATAPEDRFPGMAAVRHALSPILSPGQVKPRVRTLRSGARGPGDTLVVERAPARRSGRAWAVAAALGLALAGAALTRKPPPKPRPKPTPAATASVAPWPVPVLTYAAVSNLTGTVSGLKDLRAALASGNATAMIAARTRSGVDLGHHREYWSAWFLLDEWLEAPGSSPPPRISKSVEGPIEPLDFLLHHENLTKWLVREPRDVAASAIRLALEAPDDWRAWLFLGGVLERERRYVAARRAYRHALALPHPCEAKDWGDVLGAGLVNAVLANDQPIERAVELARCAQRQEAVWRAVTNVLMNKENDRLEALLRATLKRKGMEAGAGLQLSRIVTGQGRLFDAEAALREGIRASAGDERQRLQRARCLDALADHYLERGAFAPAAALQPELAEDSEMGDLVRWVRAPGLPATPPAAELRHERERLRLVWAHRLAEAGAGAEAEQTLESFDRGAGSGEAVHLTLPLALVCGGSDASWLAPTLIEMASRHTDRGFAFAELAGLLAHPRGAAVAERVLAAESARDPTDPYPAMTRALAARRSRRDAEAVTHLAAALSGPRMVELFAGCVYEAAFRPAWQALIAGQSDYARSLARAAYSSLPPKLIAGWYPGHAAIVKPLADGDFAASARACEDLLAHHVGYPIWWLIPVWWAAANPDRAALDRAAERSLVALRYQVKGLWAIEEMKRLSAPSR